MRPEGASFVLLVHLLAMWTSTCVFVGVAFRWSERWITPLVLEDYRIRPRKNAWQIARLGAGRNIFF